MTPYENPIGTDGFSFIEYGAPNPAELDSLFKKMGFAPIARHKRKDVTLYKQGHINFVLNNEPGSQAAAFAAEHGPSVCAMGWRVKNARAARDHAVAGGATAFEAPRSGDELELPAVEGIGGSVLYFTDTDNPFTDFTPLPDALQPGPGRGLTYIDHLTHNVRRGNMDTWAKFYEDLFNFREIRYFDIEGKLTGLISRAMTSPCGKIRIPINEATDDNSQIEEFIKEYNGEGIQHIALGTEDIFTSVAAMAADGVKFLDTPDTYYEKVNQRLPGHGEDVEKLKKHRILIDGAPTEGQGLLLQIFTETVIGPVFFELIERKGNEGFGEGNFKALFESMEEDQIRRGVLSA